MKFTATPVKPNTIAVVILNFNGKTHLQRYLPGVIKNSHSCHIYVADNGSSDGSLELLKSDFPEVQCLQLNNNLGYAGGYNTALENLEEEIFVLLNSDVEVGPDWIAPIITLFEKNPALAACQPKLLDDLNRQKFEYAGASGGFIDWLGYPFCRGRMFDSLEDDLGQYNDTREVFWASGACLFMRRSAFREAGGFDSDFFAHMEEIDLCWRLQNLGYSIMVCPQSSVYHLGGGTLNKASPHKTFLNFRNSLYCLFKNEGSGKLFYKVPLRLLLDGLAGIKFLFAGQGLHTLAILKAHFAFYSNILLLFRKRRKIHKQPGFRPHARFIYKGSIVLAYYLLGKKRFSSLKSGSFS